MSSPSEKESALIFFGFILEGGLNVVCTSITIFILLRYSTKCSGNYKWFQTVVLLSGLISDITAVVLCPTPVPYDFGFFSLSRVKFSFFGEICLFSLFVFAIMQQLAWIFLSLLYKAHTILEGEQKERLKYFFFRWTVVMYCGVPLFPLYLILSYFLELQMITTEMVETTPHYFHLIGDSSVVIFSFDVITIKLFFVTALCYVPYSFLVVTVSSVLSIRKLVKDGIEKKHSRNRLIIQKKMMYSLLAQILVPCITIGIPLGAWLISMFFGIKLLPDSVIRLVIPLMSTHTIVNCSIVIAFSPTYQRALIGLLRCKSDFRRRQTVLHCLQ